MAEPASPKPIEQVWTRAVIVAACVAVIAFVGYFFWGEFRRYRDEVNAQETDRAVRDELFSMAKAKRSEPEKVRAYCARAEHEVYDLDGQLRDNSIAKQLVINCQVQGFLD
jgi:hypothetical protein